jgi:hypothetical protein
MGAFVNLPIQVEFTNQEVNVLERTWTYPAVPQNVLVNSVVSHPQLVGDPYWTGVAPLAAYSAAATSDVSPNAST